MLYQVSFMLNVANKPFKPSVILLNVVRPSVMSPWQPVHGGVLVKQDFAILVNFLTIYSILLKFEK
jgi:hypothetical protein